MLTNKVNEIIKAYNYFGVVCNNFSMKEWIK